MHIKRISKIFTLLLALILALSVWIASPSQRTQAAAIRIMPLGDSITGSPGCWRALLWNQLQNAGYTDIDFVGTLPAQGCAVAHDGDNEGHGGILATNMADQNQLPAWLSATNPDIVIMHLGTNDVWSNRSPATILAAFSTLVDQMRANNPNMKILVAQIIPVNPSSCPECAQRTIDFNNAIPAWASSKSTAQSPITVVDQWTGFNTASDTSDGVHPNDAGNQKIANHWLPALTAALSGTPITVTPPTSTFTPPPPTTPVCPQITVAPVLVEPLTSPTSLLEQEIVVPVYYSSQQVTVEVKSESGTFSAVGYFSTTNPARVKITLLPNTTHHLTVNVIVPPWTSNGCSYNGFTMTTTVDRNKTPLTIVQGSSVPTTATTAEPKACMVAYTTNSWGNGFTADIKITNMSPIPISGWTLTYSYAAGQQITSAWNATVSQNGANVSASNSSSHWNGNIPANGGSVSFGIQGTHNGTNTIPAEFILNDVVCSGGTVTPIPPTATPTATSTGTATPTATTTTCPAVTGYVRLNSSTGNGLQGVSIYRNVSGTALLFATTNTSGYFVGNSCGVNGMTFWPELAGYTFEPATRTFTGSSSGNDFVATATTPPTATPTSPIPGSCQVAYTANSWGNGFTADIKITNSSSSVIQGWTLTWSYANGQQITSYWNATASQSGANVTASNPASHWNGTIPANGGAVSFGVQGTHSGTNTNPSNFTLNGVACNGGTVVPPSTTPTPPSATATTTTSVPPTTPPGAYTGNATYFDALGMPYGGCGITQAVLDSQNFVALNVQDTPGDYATMFSRPIAPEYASQIGMFNNGLNCGRWIRVTISDYCNGINDGAPNAGFCHDGGWVSDAYNGATLDFIVADSCQDANGWCRDDRYHVDLAKASLNLFVKDGLAVGDLYPNHWNNRQVTWEFIEAPNYSGDINIGFLKDAQVWWTPIGITHLQNGLHGVDYYENGAWVKAGMNADMGQSYLIRPTTSGGGAYRIRVYDANDQLINNGRIYNFSFPTSCGTQCPSEFTQVTYMVE